MSIVDRKMLHRDIHLFCLKYSTNYPENSKRLCCLRYMLVNDRVCFDPRRIKLMRTWKKMHAHNYTDRIYRLDIQT